MKAHRALRHNASSSLTTAGVLPCILYSLDAAQCHVLQIPAETPDVVCFQQGSVSAAKAHDAKRRGEIAERVDIGGSGVRSLDALSRQVELLGAATAHGAASSVIDRSPRRE